MGSGHSRELMSLHDWLKIRLSFQKCSRAELSMVQIISYYVETKWLREIPIRMYYSNFWYYILGELINITLIGLLDEKS